MDLTEDGTTPVGWTEDAAVAAAGDDLATATSQWMNEAGGRRLN